MIPNPESKFPWVSTERDLARGVWRNLSPAGNGRTRPPKKLGCKKGWGSTCHTLFPASRKSTFCHTTCQLSTFGSSDSCPQALHSLASLYVFLRIIMLYAETYSEDLGSGSLSASSRKRMRLCILEEDCKTAFSSHSVFFSLRFFFNGEKYVIF